MKEGRTPPVSPSHLPSRIHSRIRNPLLSFCLTKPSDVSQTRCASNLCVLYKFGGTLSTASCSSLRSPLCCVLHCVALSTAFLTASRSSLHSLFRCVLHC